MMSRDSVATAALLAERDRLKAIPGGMNEWPRNLASAVLEADDSRADAGGLVSAGDGLSWAQIVATYELALTGYLAHRLLAHGPHLVATGCETCQAGELWHVTRVIDPIMARRDGKRHGELYDEIRATLRAQIERSRFGSDSGEY